MERAWKFGTWWVMAVSVVFFVMGTVKGDGQLIGAGVFFFLVALIFNRVGWSGRGLSRNRK